MKPIRFAREDIVNLTKLVTMMEIVKTMKLALIGNVHYKFALKTQTAKTTMNAVLESVRSKHAGNLSIVGLGKFAKATSASSGKIYAAGIQIVPEAKNVQWMAFAGQYACHLLIVHLIELVSHPIIVIK